jgi:hypothetical protein
MKPAAFSVLILATIFLLNSVVSGAAEEPIGVVKNVSGQATVTRGGQVFPAAVGTRLLVDDTLMTAANGSMGVILRDNSTLSIGPGSSLVVRSFLFSPSEGKLGLLVRLSKGTMAYLSGLIGKLSPESARFETPVATIGIRGTRFLVRLDD